MTAVPSLTPVAGARRFGAFLAAPTDVAAAARLRHRLLVEESSRHGGHVGQGAGLEADAWDDRCDHLVVRDEVTDEIVATSRLLPSPWARAGEMSWADDQFDLSRHAALRRVTVTAGGGCIDPRHLSGAVLTPFLAGLARYLLERGDRYLAATVNVPVADGGATVSRVWELARRQHLVPAPLRVLPRQPFDVGGSGREGPLVLPPLLAGYLRLGARVCGRPGWDSAAGAAQFYLLLAVADIDPRTLRHLLGSAR